MGDRAPIEVIVYSCPPECVAEVLSVLSEFGLLDEKPTVRELHQEGQAGLELVRGYARGEISVGSSEEIAAALPSIAAWKVWEDPKYEHLGDVHLNHPDLGLFRADCDAQGQPVFSSIEVDRLVTATGGDRVQLGHLTGRTWEVALESLGHANKGLVLHADAPTSTPLQAVALDQLASGPPQWMPADAPGQDRSRSRPER